MALGPLRQRRDDRLAVRCDPALTAVADRVHRYHEVLNQVVLIALEAGSWRGSDFQHPVLDADAGPDLAAARPVPWLLGRCRRCRFLQATRLDLRPALQPLQTCDFRPLLRNRLLEFSYFTQ
jgi:hypothetical protein